MSFTPDLSFCAWRGPDVRRGQRELKATDGGGFGRSAALGGGGGGGGCVTVDRRVSKLGRVEALCSRVEEAAGKVKEVVEVQDLRCDAMRGGGWW